jgi:hypothetical protein
MVAQALEVSSAIGTAYFFYPSILGQSAADM